MRTIKPVIIVGQCIAFLDRIGRTSDGPRIKPRDIHYPPSPGLGLTNQDRITRKGPFVIYWISWPRVRSCCCSCCIIIRSRCHSQMVVRGIGKSQRGPRSNENSALPIQRRRWLQASSGLVWSGLPKLFRNYFHFYSHKINRNTSEQRKSRRAWDLWIFLPLPLPHNYSGCGGAGLLLSRELFAFTKIIHSPFVLAHKFKLSLVFFSVCPRPRKLRFGHIDWGCDCWVKNSSSRIFNHWCCSPSTPVAIAVDLSYSLSIGDIVNGSARKKRKEDERDVRDEWAY